MGFGWHSKVESLPIASLFIVHIGYTYYYSHPRPNSRNYDDLEKSSLLMIHISNWIEKGERENECKSHCLILERILIGTNI